MKHRHLDDSLPASPDDLPSAALLDVLERGDFADWRPVLMALAGEPCGALAARVMGLVDRYPMYGTSPLLRSWIDRARAGVEGARTAGPEVALAELRGRAGLTQRELAARMGMSQSDLSKFERRTDVRLSTLRSFVEALGGRLGLLVTLPELVCRVALRTRASRGSRRRA